jgi:hypothetical protein
MASRHGVVGMDAALRRAEQTDKLKELILLVCERAENQEHFGQVKLNKILFNIDFKAYAQRGESVSGQDYQAQRLGSTLRRMVPILEELEREGSLAIKRVPSGDYVEERPVSLRPADLGRFLAEELALVDAEVEAARDMTGTDMSEVSHEFLGWEVAAMGETIPYETVFAMKPRPLTERERVAGSDVIKRYAQGAAPGHG